MGGRGSKSNNPNSVENLRRVNAEVDRENAAAERAYQADRSAAERRREAIYQTAPGSEERRRAVGEATAARRQMRAARASAARAAQAAYERWVDWRENAGWGQLVPQRISRGMDDAFAALPDGARVIATKGKLREADPSHGEYTKQNGRWVQRIDGRVVTPSWSTDGSVGMSTGNMVSRISGRGVGSITVR